MATERDILDRKKEMSDKLSTQVRTLGLGLLAFTWGLLISDAPLARAIAQTLGWHLLIIGAFAIGVVFLDFLQYVCGYEVARKLLRSMEKECTQEGEYDYKSYPWRAQTWFFYAKQVLLFLTAVYLLLAIVTFLAIKVFYLPR